MKSSRNVSRIPARTQKAVQDTAAGCREFAAADLARSSIADTVNGRRRLDSSALSWTSRANLIERLDDSFEARQAVARAEWEDGEAAPKGRADPDPGAAS